MGLKKLRILVVDDEKDIRELIQDQFEIFGFDVDVAEGGDDAWAMFEKDPYDVVITDVRMPKGSGPELLEKIKKYDVHSPKVYFISGYYDFPKEDIFHVGADGLFPKPFSATILRESIRKASMPNLQRWGQKKFHNVQHKFKLVTGPSQVVSVGRGGLFIQCKENIPKEDEEVEFEIGFDNSLGLIKGEGRVLWSRSQDSEGCLSGVGVEIQWLSKECINEFVSFVAESSILPYIPKT
ncbi:MAG: response regulator [Bdellovibrionaceae bacterium]|jgi:DNA-binding response OmpR family regulator|nr:response regulator [Pseudobdellovibrionaceae bacterium]